MICVIAEKTYIFKKGGAKNECVSKDNDVVFFRVGPVKQMQSFSFSFRTHYSCIEFNTHVRILLGLETKTLHTANALLKLSKTVMLLSLATE